MSMSTLPISPKGLAGCVTWYALTKDGKRPSLELLLQGLGQGRLRRAWSAAGDGGSHYIAAVFQDEHKRRTKELRTPRLLDPASFCLLRIMQAAKTDIRLARNVVKKDKPDKEGHYLSMFDDLIVARVLAGARPRQMAHQVDGNHYDLRRANLRVVPGYAKFDARERAVESALDNLRRAGLRYLPGAQDFEALLRGLYELLDKAHPLGIALNHAAE